MSIHSHRKLKFQHSNLQGECIQNSSHQSSPNKNLLKQFADMAKHKKMVKDLQIQLQAEKQKRRQAQQKQREMLHRLAIRQGQFKRILNQVNENVDKFTSNPLEINAIFQKIFDNFERSNEVTNKFIEKRYQQSMRTMQFKVSNVVRVFDQQLSKMRKSSILDHGIIRQQITQIVELAKNIQDQNYNLRRNLKNQQFKNKLLEQDKKILLQQIIQKKQIINKLYIQNKMLKQLNIKNKTNQHKSHNKKFNSIDYSQQYIQKNANESLESTQMLSNRNTINYQFITNVLNRNTITPQHYKKQFTDSPTKMSTILFKKQLQQKNVQKGRNRTYSVQGHKQKIISNSQVSISNLKSNLQRQKIRNIQLTRNINKLRNQNQQINSVILQQLQKFKKNKNNDESFIQTLLKSEKLFKTIQILKRRISMHEKANFMGNWADKDFGNILCFNELQLQADVSQNGATKKDSIDSPSNSYEIQKLNDKSRKPKIQNK